MPPLTANQVLERYRDESLPEFLGRPLKDVNEKGIFGNRPVHVAAVRGDVAELAALLEGGANINAAGELGETALHFSVGQDMMEATQLLLARGAEKSIRDEDGKTPLELARILGHDKLVTLLA